MRALRFFLGACTGALLVAAALVFTLPNLSEIELEPLDCGGPGAPCMLGERSYHILVPERRGAHPVLLFFHGSRGSGGGVVAFDDLVQPALARGYAVIAPNALDIAYVGGVQGSGWLFEGQRGDRDDYAFIQEVLADASSRTRLNQSRILVAGHSHGATFLWYLACSSIDPRFFAVAPIGGTLIRGAPARCAEPPLGLNLLQTHGDMDSVVPLGGTTATGTFPGWAGVRGSLDYLINGFDCGAPQQRTYGRYKMTEWADCAEGARVASAIFPGGHKLPTDWTSMALDWFETVR